MNSKPAACFLIWLRGSGDWLRSGQVDQFATEDVWKGKQLTQMSPPPPSTTTTTSPHASNHLRPSAGLPGCWFCTDMRPARAAFVCYVTCSTWAAAELLCGSRARAMSLPRIRWAPQLWNRAASKKTSSTSDQTVIKAALMALSINQGTPGWGWRGRFKPMWQLFFILLKMLRNSFRVFNAVLWLGEGGGSKVACIAAHNVPSTAY